MRAHLPRLTRRGLVLAAIGALMLTAGATWRLASARGAPPPSASAPLDQPADSAIPVAVRSVRHLVRSAYVELSGDVEGLRTVSVGFQVPGVVASVGPTEGRAVRRGELLAALDPRDYELNLEMATAQRERAEDEYKRAQTMFAQKGIPENDFNKATTGLRLARAQEAMARKKLADSRIIAPLSGVIARRGIEPGEQAGPGLPVFTIVQLDPAQVRVGVPEAQIGRVAVGQAATITIPALKGRRFTGRVRVVGIAADPAARSYTTKIEVSNPGGVLRPGMIADVRIQSSDVVDALTIPPEAVVADAAGITTVFVYSAKEKRVHSRRVELGSAYGQEIEVRRGLGRDDLVVVGGQHRVREGSLVELGKAARGPDASAPSTPAAKGAPGRR